ncbi:Astacin [Diplonema papillatum]|nr:Astacin [Diplonema papillatum]
MLRFCLALVILSAGEGRELTGESDYVLADAVEGPKKVSTRHANPLGASVARSRLWDLGKVNYVVNTPTSSPDSDVPYLAEDDQRIVDAIADWEQKTCIRFTKCATEADCPEPYLLFRGSTTLGGCSSSLGKSPVNSIELGVHCSLTAAIHEIGHSVGLYHEMSRGDRDNYVRVDFDQIRRNLRSQYDQDSALRNIGEYDYASVMHYGGGATSIGTLPSIVTTEKIGAHDARLSEGDAAAIDFMYNGCSDTYVAPRCITNASAALLIPHSKDFIVVFYADWNAGSSMTVSYGSTNASGASFYTASGTDVGSSATEFITLRPSPSDAGRTFRLAATFTSTGAGAESSTCQVVVKVATSTSVCFGLSADDESVCGGGGGTCTSDSGIPCLCTGQHTGKQCEEHPCKSKSQDDDATSTPPCYEYLLLGNLTRPTHAGLNAGGLMLTVSIAGGNDWVDSEATKQAFIDGLTAASASPSPTGWTALKSTMMNTTLVTISGSTLTLGPLAAGSFYTTAPTVVSLTLDASMVTSGTLGAGSDDLFFVIPASFTCPAVEETFDRDETFFSGAELDTSFRAAGAASVYFPVRDGSRPYIMSNTLDDDLYTSISYYIAMNDTDYLPRIDFLQADISSCWKMDIAATGLTFNSDTASSVDLPLELNRFYFVEHLIDYSTGMMTVRVDGEVQIENFASKSGSTCTTEGISRIVFLNRGWLDELRLVPPCSQYEIAGTLTSPVHKELVAGGLMLTVSINEDVDVWVDIEATKQAFIDGLVADSSSTPLTGWNALKSTMMDTSLVRISGSKMTLGPLNPAASFFERSSTTVSLTLQDGMVARGTLGEGSVLSFVIPATLSCPENRELAFDSDSAAFSGSVVDTSFKAKGQGSAYFGKPPYSISTSLQSGLYTSISYYIALNDTDSLPGIDIIQSDFVSCWKMDITATGLTFTSRGSVAVNMSLELNRFYFVEHLIDYSTGMMTVRVDGEVKIENFASQSGSSCTTVGIDRVVFLNRGWLDELLLKLPCPRYKMTGTLTSPVHSDLVDGGLMLTVSIKGDLDVWVDTEATKQAFIDGLVADSSSTPLTGWNALKSTMMNTSLVRISGSEMTLGPLKTAASFLELTSTVVSLTLKGGMMASGILQDGSGDMSFTIPPPLVCPESEEETFDAQSTAFPGSVVDANFSAVGAGSASFKGPHSIFATSTAKQFSKISFYVARGAAASPGFDILDENWGSCWHMYLDSTALRLHSSTSVDAPMSVENGKFYFIELLLDYPTGTMSVFVDGEVKLEDTPKAESECLSVGFKYVVFLNEGWLDEFQLQC